MRLRLSFAACALLSCAICASVGAASFRHTAFVQSYSNQDKPKSGGQESKKGGQNVSPEEAAAIKKLNAAPDAASKLKIAADLVKKSPKNPKRAELAGYMASQISGVKDAAQRISLSENYLAIFTEASEANYIIPVLLDSYIETSKFDEAFQVGATAIEKNPNDVAVRTQLALAGSDQLRRGNSKYAQQAQQYALKAIELIEADKKPADIEAATWADYKTKWLPTLYQSVTLMMLAAKNNAEAKSSIQKAIAARKQPDPFDYFYLGSVLNAELEQMTGQYKIMKQGAEQDAFLQKIHAHYDQIIDAYAHVIALSEGNAQYQQLHDAILNDLQTYYKFRHNGSADGMQQLIDKYKQTAKP